MKKIVLTLIITFALGGSIFAQDDTWNPLGLESHWPEFYNGPYDFQGAIVASITIDDEIISQEDPRLYYLEVASFIDGSDECRGNQYFLYDQYVIDWGDPYPILNGNPIYYNDAGETIYFMMYDHLNNIEYESCTITLEGEPFVVLTGDDNMQGWFDPEQPIFLNFYSPATEATRVIAGYGADNNNSGWVLIASPIDGVNPADAGLVMDPEENFDLYRFNQCAELQWENWKKEGDHNHFNLEVGKGYLYACKEGTIMTVTGTFYEGEGSFWLEYDDEALEKIKGFNLVGNPYTTTASIDMPYYRLDETGSYFLTETEDGDVAPLTGVLVQATEPSQEVTFTPANGKRGNSIAKANIVVSNNGKTVDKAIIRFDEGATLGKMQFHENSTKLSIAQDNSEYAIVKAEMQGEMPVNFKAEKNGTYTLSFNTENIEMGYLHLIDNLTGNDVDLLATPSYSFEANTTDYASRFRLVFSADNANDSQFAFISNGEIVLTGQGTVQVYDVTGRLISSHYNATRIATENMAAGVYMLRLINGENVKTQKIVVK